MRIKATIMIRLVLVFILLILQLRHETGDKRLVSVR